MFNIILSTLLLVNRVHCEDDGVSSLFVCIWSYFGLLFEASGCPEMAPVSASANMGMGPVFYLRKDSHPVQQNGSQNYFYPMRIG